MNAQNSIENQNNPVTKSIATGVILITIGLAFFVGQVLNIEWQAYFIMAGLGGLFLASGLITRNEGLLVPGGILSGISLGLWAMKLPMLSNFNEGGLFLTSFAAGWAVVFLSSLIIGKPHWWALIPGGIMLLIGGSLLAGGYMLTLMRWLGTFGWPLILIGVGAYVILRKRNA
jgi:hypothetical protein